MKASEFRRLRKQLLCMTQTQLADAMGITQLTISRIERGELRLRKVHELAIRQIVDQEGYEIETA